MITLLLVVIAAVLIWSMSARSERLRALVLAVIVLILSTRPWMDGARIAITNVMNALGSKLG